MLPLTSHRDEAQAKMSALRERSEKDQSQYNLELKELKRIIDHEQKLKAFMSTKAQERAEVKALEAAKRKKRGAYACMFIRWYSDDVILLCFQTNTWYCSKQTNQSMNRMIKHVIQYILCVLPMRKIWHFSGKFDQHLSLYCGAVKSKLQTGSCESLVRYDVQN